MKTKKQIQDELIELAEKMAFVLSNYNSENQLVIEYKDLSAQMKDILAKEEKYQENNDTEDRLCREKDSAFWAWRSAANHYNKVNGENVIFGAQGESLNSLHEKYIKAVEEYEKVATQRTKPVHTN